MKLVNVMYEDAKLPIYCKNHNIDYIYIRKKLYQYRKERKFIFPLNIQISIAIKAFENRRFKYKWRSIPYKGTTLIKYCYDNNIIYNKIASRCKYYVQTGNDFSNINDSKIDSFLQSYFSRKEILYLQDKLTSLNKELSNTELKSLCIDLNINYSKLLQSKKENFNVNQFIILTYFSSDKYNAGHYLSQKRLNELEKNINLDINDLIGLYKSGKNEYLEIILDNERCYLKGFIFQMIRKYNFMIAKTDYDDLYQQAELLLLKCINKIAYPDPGRIITYLKKCITMQMLSYLKNNYSNKNLPYDDTILCLKRSDNIEL